MDELTKRRLSKLYKLKEESYTLDDITFEDLNLDEIFERINRTSSCIGEEVLYSMLRSPLLSKEDIQGRREDIKKLEFLPDELLTLRKQLKLLPRLNKISVFEYLNRLNQLLTVPMLKLCLPALMLIVSIALIFICPPVGVILSVLVFFVNSIRYFKLRDAIRGYLISVSYLSKTVKRGAHIPFVDRSRLQKIAYLKSGALLLGVVSGETIHGGSGNPFDVIIDLLRMGFHIDLIKFYSLINRIKRDYEDIEGYLLELGYFDALSSIIASKEDMCEAYFVDEDKYIAITNGIHPLIENAVANSITLQNQNILLTGSNASGKSTFLRMVAVNAVLAQSLLHCYALGYRASIFRIISSISVRDSLIKGESFYMAEVKALKRIVDLCSKEGPQVICFVDEVLNGTNTYERILAATGILKYLGSRSMCFAATHDIELTENLNESFMNYHFSEEISNNDIFFSFLLKEGAAKSRNAIRLLEYMGFPSELCQVDFDMG